MRLVESILPTIAAIFITAGVAYLGACGALFAFQRSLIYYPQPKFLGSSANMLKLQVAGTGVLVTVRPRPGRNALLYFGGNAEDVSFNLPSLSQAFPEHAIYLLHYRGYGGSEGTPSEAAIQQDALALFDQVNAEHPDVVVVGRSLGSGVALHLASQRTVSRLVLVTPFDSLETLVARQFPYFPVKWLLRDKFESRQYAPRITAPTLIVSAEHDEIVPRASTEQLFARFGKGVATYREIPGTGHNTVSESPLYLATIRGGP